MMKYKKYMDNFFVEKDLVWIQVGFFVGCFIILNTRTHLLYHDTILPVISLIPTYLGIIIGTISYFKENKNK